MSSMPSMDPSAEPTSDDKLWSMLAYVLSPLVPIIILVMEDKKNRPFIKSHAMQALVLGALNVVVGGVLSFTLIGACVPVVVWFYMIYLGVQAYQGKAVTIPVITDFVKNQGWA